MRILAIETSCDETGAAVVEKEANKPSVTILSNKIARMYMVSQLKNNSRLDNCCLHKILGECPCVATGTYNITVTYI